jgi:hypothetical protein
MSVKRLQDPYQSQLLESATRRLNKLSSQKASLFSFPTSMNMSHLLPIAQKPKKAPKSKAEKKLESEEDLYTELSREVFPLATPEGLEQRQNAKDELVAQSQHSMAERHKQFPISDVKKGLDAPNIEDAPLGLSKPAVARQDTSPSASSRPGDKAQNSIDLASPTPTPSPEPEKQVAAETEKAAKSPSDKSGRGRGPVPAEVNCLMSPTDAASPKNSNTTRKRIRAALPGAADNLRFSSKHTEHPLAQQKRKRAVAEDDFIPNSPQTAEASTFKKSRFKYPASLSTNRDPSSYNSPYPNPPAQKPQRFRNPPEDEDDDLPGPVQHARIATPIFRPINYEPATRRALPPSLSPTSHQRLHHLLVDILPADVSSNLAAPGTTPQEVLKAVETATSEEVAKTRRVTIEAIDGLLATYGQRRDLLDGSMIMGFLENNRVVVDQVKKMTSCVQRYGVVDKWAAKVGDGKNPESM